jgi:hypothetical protein
LKLKSLLVITLFVVACSFASAQTFGFASVDSGLYCNYEQLSAGGSGYWGGSDNLSACGVSVNSTISGFNASLSNDGEPGHGAGVIYGDSIYAALSGDPYAQWTVWTALKANKQNKEGFYTGKYSWVGVAAFSGEYVGGNYGYLSASIPSKSNGDAALRGTAAGKKANFKK